MAARISCRTEWSPVPTCSGGVCNMTTNECRCNDGYIDDRVVGRYRNCGVLSMAGRGFAASALVCLCIALLYCFSVWVFRSEKKSISKLLAMNSTFSCLLFSAYLIILLSSPDFETPWYGAMLVCIATAIFARVAGLMVVASVRPIVKFSRRALNARKFEVYLLRVVPGVLMVSLLVCLSTAHGVGTDEAVSDAVGVAYIIVSLAALGEFPFLYSFLGLLLESLTQLIEIDTALDRPVRIETKDSASSLSFSTSQDEPRAGQRKLSAKEATSQSMIEADPQIMQQQPQESHPSGRNRVVIDLLRFRRRIWILRWTTCTMALFLFSCGTSVGGIQLVTGVVPLSYAIFFSILHVIAFLCIFITSYAKRRDKRTFVVGGGTHMRNHMNHRDSDSDAPNNAKRSSYHPDFTMSNDGPKLRTIVEASETSRWSQVGS